MVKHQPQGSFNAESKQLFDTHVKGKNIMTPDIIRYGVAGKYAYELSEGTDFKHRPIFGVTVLRRKDGAHRTELGRCCHSIEEAEEYILEIVNNLIPSGLA